MLVEDLLLFFKTFRLAARLEIVLSVRLISCIIISLLISTYSYAYNLEEVYLDVTQLKHSKSIGHELPSEAECWKYIKQKLPENTFIQFGKLLTDENFSIQNIEHLVKISEDEYIMGNAFPIIGKGLYKIKLPEDLSQEPTISNILSFSDKIIKVILAKNNDIWFFTKGSSMSRGFGYDEFSLFNAKHPDKSLILTSFQSLSEERGGKIIMETPWENIESEIKEHHIEEIGDFIGYRTYQTCIEVTTFRQNLRTKKEALITDHACVEENGVRIWKTILLEKTKSG